MTKIAQIINETIHWITPWSNFNDIPEFSPNIIFENVPEEVEENWVRVDGKWVSPVE